MIPAKHLCLISAVCCLGACQSEEVAAICTTLGTVEAGLSVEVLYPDGGQISAVSNPGAGEVSVTYQTYEDDMVSVLQEAALAALDAPVPDGSTLCEGQRAGSLTVLFDDGAQRHRHVSCLAVGRLPRCRVRHLRDRAHAVEQRENRANHDHSLARGRLRHRLAVCVLIYGHGKRSKP